MEVVFWSTGCPKCKVLQKKLEKMKVKYVLKDDIDEMVSQGIKSAPCLTVDGRLLKFPDAVAWVNGLEQKV